MKKLFRQYCGKTFSNVKFSPLSKDPMEYFLLDSKTGELRTAKPLDKEALPDATGLMVFKVRVSVQ